jgi:UDP-GlcNAc:undecaprenyl-phosphate/decaprenyl-phosphate GlcNAc-1-phosphate transferase
MILFPFMVVLLGLGTVLVVVPALLSFCPRAERLNQRPDLHHGKTPPVPRFGGLALAAAFIVVNVVVGIISPAAHSSLLFQPAILLSCLAMFCIGFIDDIKPMGARKKLLAQIVIAAIVCFSGVSIQTFKIPFTGHVIVLGSWGVLLTILWLVGITNLINLIDGVDGLAAGIALMLMALLGYVGHETGDLELLIAGMGGALLGFLCFNFPPARIYMGDGGAYFLGFQIGVFAIQGSHKGEVITALAAPLFVLVLPILDASLAILRRGLRGLPLFRPDRRHLHHHLLNTGLSHRKIVLIFYGITLVFLAMGIAAYWSRGHLVPVLLGASVLIVLLGAGQFKFSRRWFAVGRMVDNSLKMRREIEYAVCLSRWLALEGRREQGVENLWQTLVVIAERLGFTSVRLSLADGERAWSRVIAPKRSEGGAVASKSGEKATTALRSYRHKLLGGRCGVLEVHSPISEGEGETGAAAARSSRQRNWASPNITDEGLSETITELLAEGWIRAASNYINDDDRPLHFSDGKTSRETHTNTNSAGSRVSSTPAFPLAGTLDPGATQAALARGRSISHDKDSAADEQQPAATPAFWRLEYD